MQQRGVRVCSFGAVYCGDSLTNSVNMASLGAEAECT